MNNQMDDFATPGHVNSYGIPASPANMIEPGKQPLSSMTPTIVVSKSGDVRFANQQTFNVSVFNLNNSCRLVIGGAGGSRIPTGVAFSIIKHLFMDETLVDAIAARRLHHQLLPMQLEYEAGFDNRIVEELKTNFGHEMIEAKPDDGFAAVVGISKNNEKLEGSVDPRRGGSVEYY